MDAYHQIYHHRMLPTSISLGRDLKKCCLNETIEIFELMIRELIKRNTPFIAIHLNSTQMDDSKVYDPLFDIGVLMAEDHCVEGRYLIQHQGLDPPEL